MKNYYKSLYEKNARFYKSHPLALRAILCANLALTGFFCLAYIFLFIYAIWITPQSAKAICGILFAPAFCFFIIYILRLIISRPRPYSEKGANIVPFLHKKISDMQSFPSRHAACAFVIASVYLPFLPVLAIVLYVLGLALTYIRFALGLHYPTDLFGGILLGILVGFLIFLFL